MSESETPELKPCPFCGGPAKLTKRNNGYGEVGCVLCCVWTSSSSNSNEHIAVWNSRAAESRLAESEEALEAMTKLNRLHVQQLSGSIERKE